MNGNIVIKDILSCNFDFAEWVAGMGSWGQTLNCELYSNTATV